MPTAGVAPLSRPDVSSSCRQNSKPYWNSAGLIITLVTQTVPQCAMSHTYLHIFQVESLLIL